MNLQRMGRLISTVTITLGILGAVIGSLLSYSIPNASQMFVDFVQDSVRSAMHAREHDHHDHAPSIIATTSPASIEIEVQVATATVKPVPSPVTSSTSTAGQRLTVGIAATQPGQRPDTLLLLGHGAALGGATGLIIGLPLGVLVSIIDWIFLTIAGLVDAIRFRLFKTSTAFRR